MGTLSLAVSCCAGAWPKLGLAGGLACAGAWPKPRMCSGLAWSASGLHCCCCCCLASAWPLRRGLTWGASALRLACATRPGLGRVCLALAPSFACLCPSLSDLALCRADAGVRRHDDGSVLNFNFRVRPPVQKLRNGRKTENSKNLLSKRKLCISRNLCT